MMSYEGYIKQTASSIQHATSLLDTVQTFFFEYHGRHRSRPRLSNHDKITLCSAGSKGAEKGATVVEWIYTGDGVHIRAAPDGRKLFHVARCMSAGMIHRIGVRGCWRWSVAVRMTAFHQFGAKGTKRMPLSVPPHTSSYTCPNPAPTALPLLSSIPLHSAYNLSYLIHKVFCCLLSL